MGYLKNKSVLIVIVLLLPLFSQANTMGEEANETNQEFHPVSNFYPFDGAGHHPLNSDYNKVGSDLSRLSPNVGLYEDNYVSRVDSPSAREISNQLCIEHETVLDENGLSDYNWIWGQFLSHDISFVLTQNGRVDGSPESMFIPIPEGDAWMDPFSVGSLIMRMDRSVYNTSTSTAEIPREFPNSITGWLDGSHVYGSSNATSEWLRANEGGKLKTYDGFNGEFLPLADDDDDSTPPVSFASFSPSKRYVAGDPRANEHAALTAMHVLFVREHNRIADEITSSNPAMLDEEVFQLARKINTAQMQYITYYEYLPSLGVILPEYTGFDPSVDPRISNSFATLAFRMGHSQITESTLRLDTEYRDFYLGNISMADGFWNPDRLNSEGGIAPIFRGAAMTTQAANDMKYTDALRNSMFGDPGFGGLDMCAIDIQRARGHGLPDYNTLRSSIGLDRIDNWSEIIDGDSTDLEKLQQVYPNIDNSDPIMGMYAEKHLTGSVLGETMHALLHDQYLRLRDGDILYFENDLELEPYISDIRQSSLANVILRNTEITSIQCDIMYAADRLNDLDCYSPPLEKYPPSVGGTVIIDSFFSNSADLGVTFTEVTESSGLSSVVFDEKYMWSSFGPTLSLGDCNNDGNEDIWLGASYDHIGFETGVPESHSRTYLLIGDGRGNFEDFTEEAGLLNLNSTAFSATWVDYDNDGDLDIYQSNYGIITDFQESQTNLTRNTLYANDGDCKFIDVTLISGLGNGGYSTTSSWGDYDNDGDLDLYSANLGIVNDFEKSVFPQSDVFYHNMLAETGEAFFEDYSTEVGEVYGTFLDPDIEDELSFSSGLSFALKSVDKPSAQASILPNLEDVDYGDKLKGTGATWALLFVDMNSDGGDDLLIGSDFGISPMYKNMQNGEFLLYTQQSRVDIPGTAMGFDAADMDGDLDLDYCQSNFGPNYLFQQNGDLEFDNVGLENGMSTGYASQSVTWDCNFIDVDLDGDLDLWFGSGNINPFTSFSPNTIYLNDGDGNFLQGIGSEVELFSPIGKTMGSVWADFDNDGDLDVIISQSNTGVHYFENNAADRSDKNWIGIDVYQQYTNDSASTIANGAIVDIYFSNGKSVRQVVKIGSGYAGSKDTTINLGIPEGESLTKVVITWKDGTAIEYHDLEINQYHTIQPNDSFNQQESLSTQDDSSLVTLSVVLITILIVFVRFFPRQD